MVFLLYQLIDDKFSDLEIIGVTLSNFYPKLQLFAVYRPPYYDCGALQDMKQLVDCLTQCTSNACIHIIAGDFNLHRINWNSFMCCNDAVHSLFLDFIIQNSWSQLVFSYSPS